MLLGRCGEETDEEARDRRRLMRLTERISCLRPDHTEFACLKALALFAPGNTNLSEYKNIKNNGLHFTIFQLFTYSDGVDTSDVGLLQDQTLRLLREYSGPARGEVLLSLLLSVGRVSRPTVLRVFFNAASSVPLSLLLRSWRAHCTLLSTTRMTSLESQHNYEWTNNSTGYNLKSI